MEPEKHTEACIQREGDWNWEIILWMTRWPGHCQKCQGRGTGPLQLEFNGLCEACLGIGMCPRCGGEIDEFGLREGGKYVCLSCGWADGEREDDFCPEEYFHWGDCIREEQLSLELSKPLSVLVVGRPEGRDAIIAWLASVLPHEIEVVGTAHYGGGPLVEYSRLTPDLVIFHADAEPLLPNIAFHNPWPSWEDAKGDDDLADWVVAARRLKRVHREARSLVVSKGHVHQRFAYSAGILASIWFDDAQDQLLHTFRIVAGRERGLRALRFPETESLGIVSLEPAGQGVLVYTPAHLGDARGVRLVPPGELVRLRVPKETRPDLTLLRDMAPDDLFELDLTGTLLEDGDLRYLSHLTGLSVLRLDQTGIGSPTMAHLRELTGLSTLSLNGTRVSDYGLSRLNGLQRLRHLEVAGTPVTLEMVEEFPSVGFVVSWGPSTKEALEKIGNGRAGDWFVHEDIAGDRCSLLRDHHW